MIKIRVFKDYLDRLFVYIQSCEFIQPFKHGIQLGRGISQNFGFSKTLYLSIDVTKFGN
jgi:hypothetical protein